MTNEKEIYAKYLNELKSKLIEKYKQLGLKASGKYEDELDYGIRDRKLTVTAPYHAWFMEHGRRPSKKFPPRKAIEDWIEVKKGLPPIFREKKKQFAYLIARKIAREGIKVPNHFNKGKVISDVVESFLGETVHKMLNELSFVFLRDIRSDILKSFPNATDVNDRNFKRHKK